MKTIKFLLKNKIIIGLIFGLLYGLIATQFGFINFTINWVKPFGTIFINLLKILAIPFIFTSLVHGISGMTDISKLSKIGVKTLALYLLTTVIAIIIGLSVVGIIKPARFFPQEKSEQLLALYQENITSISVSEQGKSSPLQFLIDIIPENIVSAASNNKNMLQIIFFAILFGIAIVTVGKEKTKPLINLIEILNEVFIKIINIIMKYAPFGVFALLGSIIVEVAGDSGSSTINLLGTLGLYAITVLTGLFIIVFAIYPLLIKLITKRGYMEFLKAIFPAQLVAFSTSSSMATLPVTMRQCKEKLELNPSTVSFVLPVGATVNMDGTSLYQAVAAVFIANIFGIDLTFMQQLTIILTATLASIGSAGVPSAGVIMLVIVLESIGIPAAGITLILAVDRPLDMFRTVVNITGDCVVCSIVDKYE